MKMGWAKDSVTGKLGFVLGKKLKNLKLKLKSWAKENYGRFKKN